MAKYYNIQALHQMALGNINEINFISRNPVTLTVTPGYYRLTLLDTHTCIVLLSCQPRVKVTSCFVYIVIRDLYSIDHLCINPIRRIGLIHK